MSVLLHLIPAKPRLNSSLPDPSLAGMSNIPAEAVKFAKKMGIAMDGFEAEAEDIWSMLNDMSEKNMDEYQTFIQQQFKDQEKADDTGEDKAKFFRPQPEFCVTTTSLSGDGIKVRLTDASGPTGKQVFINICSHDVVEVPKDHRGKPISDWSNSADVEIPLAVGPLRDLDNQSSLAVDVLANAVVLARCRANETFKGQIIELVLDSVTADKGVQLKKTWSIHADKYVGGRGVDKKTPVLFPVNGPAGADDARTKDATKMMQSPSMLLGAIKQERQELDVIMEPTRGGGDGDGGGLGGIAKSAVIQASSSSAPALKKGFLNADSRPALYPEGGSEEGKGGATGGAYERLMSRCQVIDSRGVSQPTLASQASAAAVKPTKFADTHRPSKTEMQQMEKLLSKVDDEWASGIAASDSALEASEFTKALEEMSHIILGPVDQLGQSGRKGAEKIASSRPALPEDDIVVTGDLKVHVEVGCPLYHWITPPPSPPHPAIFNLLDIDPELTLFFY